MGRGQIVLVTAAAGGTGQAREHTGAEHTSARDMPALLCCAAQLWLEAALTCPFLPRRASHISG